VEPEKAILLITATFTISIFLTATSGLGRACHLQGQRILLKELQILPAERMLTLRYPRLKWDLFGWDAYSAMQHALNPTTAFTQKDRARVGFQNDGFMGDAAHYAMFQLPNESKFMAQDSEFVVHHGEISDAGPYKLKTIRS
jgi:hypothetical protein